VTYPKFVKFFARERQTLGEEACLREYFPQLAKGPGGDFFHAVIELGYYVEAEGPPETLDSGLAWLAAAYVEWPENEDVAPYDSPRAAMDALMRRGFDDDDREAAPDLNDGSSGYIHAMEALIEEKSLLRKVYAYDVDVKDNCVKDMCLAAADSFYYGGANDFYTLHSVSGSRAVWAILSAVDWPLDVQRNALRALWRTILFTHIARRKSFNFVEEEELQQGERAPPEWADLRKAALATKNSHLTKLVFTCADFYDRWGDLRHYNVAREAIDQHKRGNRLVGTGAGSKIDLYVR